MGAVRCETASTATPKGLKDLKIEWTRFTRFFARPRAAKYGVFFLVFGTTFLLPLDSAGAVQVQGVQVICADPSGAQRTFTIGWDNSQTFFQGKGQISRFFCEGGYAGNYRTFVSNNLNDSTLDYYQGIAPAQPAPVVSESQTSTADSPTATQTPAPQPTESATAQTPTETSTVQLSPTVPDSSTATVSDTPTVQSDSPTVRVDSPTASVDSPTSTTQDSQTAQIPAPVSDSLTATVPVAPSLPVPDSSTPVQDSATVIAPTAPLVPSSPVEPSPTPAPTVSEPIAVVPAPAPTPPVPAPSPEIAPPAPEPVQPPAPEPAPPAPVEPEPAPPVEPEPLPPVEPAPPVETLPPDPVAIADPIPAPDPVALPDPVPPTDPVPAAPIPVPVNSDPSPAPVSINDVDVATLAPETPVELENGVILTAEVVVALVLLENPSELISAIFTDPAQALMALANVGADMSPEVREKAEDTIIAAVIAGGIATQSAVTAAGAAAYRRNP